MKQFFREAQNRFLSVIRFLLLPGIVASLLLLGLGVWAAVETKFALIPMTKRSQALPNAHVADGSRTPSKNLSSAGSANSYSTPMQMCPAGLTVTNGNTGTWVNTSGATVNIRIAAVGAGGGKNTGTNNGAVNTFFGGSGASIAGDFTVAPGESVFLIAGAPGQNSLNGGSGGGGSGAVNCGNPANCGAGTILLLAGGGGGTSGYASGGGGRATSSTGAGGTNNSRNAAGGGGLNSAGQDGIMVDAMNPNPTFFSTAKGGGQVSKTGISNGGAAGKNNGVLGTAGGNGMGGGGASDGGGYAAGGGGQTGGNGEDDAGGNNGGYSLPGGTNQTNTAGADGGGAIQGSVALTCLGVVSAPNIAVSETGVGNIADGTSFAFGATKVGMSVTKTFMVTNSGSANLTLSNLTVPTGFTFTNFVSTTVAPNTSTTFSVTMTAAAAGAPSGSLSFDNNDAGKTPFNFTISGTVFAPPTVSKFFVNPNQSNSNNTSLNGTARLAIAITNPPGNAGSLTGLAITDTFPAGLEVDSPVVSSNTCGGTFAPSAGATSISFSGGGPLTVGNQCTIFVVVKATMVGAIVNTTGNVSSTEGGAGLTASGTLNVFAPPTIAKAFGASVVAPNTPTTMSFTITNPAGNPGNLTGVGFSDTLMSGLQIAPTPGLTNNGFCGSPTTTGFTTGSTSLMVSGATVTTANQCVIMVNVIGATTGTVNNTTTAITSTQGGMGATSNTATLNVASPPTVTKSFSPTQIPVGGISTLTLSFTNPNAAISLTNLSITDSFPAGVEVDTSPMIGNTCGGTFNPSPGATAISLSGGSLGTSPSNTCSISVRVKSTTPGVKSNITGNVSSAESGTGSTASATLTVVGPPSLAKAFTPPSIPLGMTSSLGFTITNSNPASALSGITFTDSLPANLVVSDATTPNVCGMGSTLTVTAATRTITLTGGSLAAGNPSPTTCTFNVTVGASAAGSYTNMVNSISSIEGGTNSAPVMATLAVVAPPSISKSFSPMMVQPGQTSTLTLTISNLAANTVALTGVGFTDTFPNAPNLIVANPTGATLTGCGGATLTDNLGGALAPGDLGVRLSGATVGVGGTCTVTVNIIPQAQGPFVNITGNVSSTNGGTGNTATATLTTNTPPTITPVAISRAAGSPGSNSTIATVGDNETAPGSLIVTIISANPSNGVTLSSLLNTNGTISADAVATCSATNASFTLQVSDGNLTSTGTLNVTVTPDNILPTIAACPANITNQSAGANCMAVVSFIPPTANDNCTGNPTVTCTPASGSSFALGTTTVSCTATDAASNTSAACTFTVQVVDSTAPTIAACPANITNQAAGANCMATVTFTPPTANDNCAGATVTCTPASGSSFALGTTTVSCTATDAASNTSAACTFTVQVVDSTAPTIAACPANITNQSAGANCMATVTFTPPPASDNCTANPTVTCAPASGSSFALGTTTVSCTATDAASNTSAACTFTVQVVDSTAPTLSACPANITNQSAGANCTATVTFTPPTANDNCAGVTVTCTPASGSSFALGTTTVSCIATDAASNTSAACTFTVQVVDSTAPTLGACPANIAVNTATNSCAATVTFTAPTVSDNCAGATVVCSPASGSSFAKGVTTVTCTPTDAANNTGSACTFTVTVTDNQNPTIACAANQSVTSNVPVVVNYPAPTASDNCAGVTTSCTPASGSTFQLGVTTVNCTATDAVNLTATCSFTVSLNNTPVGSPVTVNTPPVTVTFDNVTSGGVTTVTPIVPVPATPPPPNGYFIQNTNFAYDVSTTAGYNGAVTVCFTVPDSLLGTVKFGNLRILHLENGVWVDRTILAPNTPAPNPATRTICARTTTLSPFVLAYLAESPGPGLLASPTSEKSDQKAGSVLVYNVYTSGTTSANTQNTRINLTNTNPQQTINVHLFFVAEGCSIADSYVCLTANQTTSFLASDLDPGTTGYLVAVAVDDRGCPTFFNYLIGDEYVKFTSGHAANLAAESFAALDGGLPVCDGNSVTAQLNFDGISYNRTPATLALSNIGSRADGNDTLLIVNRIGGNLGIGASSLGTLFGIMYDDAENALSFSVAGNCQLRNSISNNFPRTTPRFESFIPAGRTGWLKIYNQTGAIGITGAAINFNANAASSAGAFNQGHNLHHLTLNATSSYVIPVFPPSC